MKGIYHNRDLDGFASGAIMKLKYPKIELIGFDYGMEFDLNLIEEGEQVIMADISLPIEDLRKLTQKASKVVWIDHHISAKKDYDEAIKKSPIDVIYIYDSSIAACELVWKHLFPRDPMPYGVLLLGMYDSWRNNDKDLWQNEILSFQYGMRLKCNNIEQFPKELFENHSTLILHTIKEGKLLLKYEDQQNELYCRSLAFESEFQGLNAICLNKGFCSSNTFNSVYEPLKHDIMVSFSFSDGKWNFSLRSDKDNIDCSKIAKSLGGGGHKGAAGFRIDDIKQIFPNLF